MKHRSWKRSAIWTVVGLVVSFGLIQLIPYGHTIDNPPVVKEPNWDGPQTSALARQACFDCHSNETRQWWAIRIAPFSWLAAADVSGARGALNFSDWRGGGDREELQNSIRSGSMPPLQYTIAHSGAKLSATEKQQLIDGLQATIAQTP